MSEKVEEYRQQLNAIDREIIALLEKRFDITHELGNFKFSENLPIENLQREAEIYEYVYELTGRHDEEVSGVFRSIMNESKLSQGRSLYGPSDVFLIGMPGCGKSRIALKLAEKLYAKDIDLDERFQKEYGFFTGEFIKRFGEEDFRRNESLVLEETINKIFELRKNHDNMRFVISCGGGIVLKKRNTDLMANHGIVVYIRRDISLLDLSGRPLSNEKGIDVLYEERHQLYEESADIIVDNNSDIDSCVDAIALKLHSYKGLDVK